MLKYICEYCLEFEGNIVSNVGENNWILLVLVCMVMMFYLDMRWYN